MATNDLIAVIKQKQAAIAKMQAELDEARKLLSGFRTTPHADLFRAKEQKFAPVRSKTARKARAESRAAAKAVAALKAAARPAVQGILVAGSVARTVEVLRDAGKPMYVMDIIKEIEARYGEKVLKDTLVGNLSRYVKAKKIFYRTGPNVYGLLDMKAG